MNIQGKTAVVTGGASGLGRATVESIIAKGGNVAIFDLNDEAGSALAAELGERAFYQRVNVADESNVRTAIEAVVAKFGAIHICVNCAGIGIAKKTLPREGEHSFDEFNRIIQVNLCGTFNVLRLAAQQMAKNDPDEGGERGVIVNTASVAAFDGQMGQAAYSASKGGVVGMTLPIARDLSANAIRVNTIAPGLINTPLFNSLPDEAINALVSMIQSPKRLGNPSEYAQLATHIVENSYLNGETIRLDGAIRMQAR